MESRLSYTLVGLFVLVLGGALIALVLWLSAAGSDVEYRTYVAYMTESVSGLNTEAKVKYRGVDVGEVREISLAKNNPERVRLLLDIERGTPVKTDTEAILATQGITGLAYVDLTGGSREAPLLEAPPGKPYPEIPTGPSLLVRLDTAVSSLVQSMGEAAADLSAVAARINQVLDEDNQAAFASTLASVEQLSAGLAGRVDDLGQVLTDAGAILGNAAQVSEQLPALVGGVKGSVDSVQQAIADIGRAAGGVDRMVAETQRELISSSSQTLAQVDTLLVELSQLTRSLQRLSQELERDPNMLLFGGPSVAPGPGE